MDDQTFQQLAPIDQLLRVMACLRDKEHGCPWDLEQTIQSLREFTLEEAYEVVEAIEGGDRVELEDELGDLLFQVVFYARLAQEEGSFEFDGVAKAITQKLIRRHPHVFPGGKISNFGVPQSLNTDEVITNWDEIKRQEKEAKRLKGGKASDLGAPASALDGVPVALPALPRSGKLQGKAAKAGFDWAELPPVIAKLKEEIAELEQAVVEGDRANIQHELGDVLFSAVNVSRHCGLDSEQALRAANTRFQNRFQLLESMADELKKPLEEMSLAEMDQLWDKAKKKLAC